LLYLAGDTIWCPEVEEALATHRPNVVVLNTGAAQFLTGDPITMTADDVIAVCQAAPDVRIIAVHLETINHCRLTRAALRAALEEADLAGHVNIPADGERITLT
jgi:L-ascorbate metabolism protein UlaG (beta-lactamase superfamily)